MLEEERDTPGTLALQMTTRRTRGRRRGPTKAPATIRFDIEVLEALKASGPGWQTRVNNVIRNWILGARDIADEQTDFGQDRD